MDNLEAKYGLDRPVWEADGHLILRGLGRDPVRFRAVVSSSRTGSVNDIIAQGFPVTLTYGVLSFIVAAIVGITLGVTGAIRQNTIVDGVAVTFSMAAQVLPNFIMAPLLIVAFTLWPTLDGGEPWLPGGGWNGGALPNLVMPVIALSTSYMASITRITRASMIEVLNSNFIRTARAKGLPDGGGSSGAMRSSRDAAGAELSGPRLCGDDHRIGADRCLFLDRGIGQFFVNSAFNRDYSVIMGITILVGALTILVQPGGGSGLCLDRPQDPVLRGAGPWHLTI